MTNKDLLIAELLLNVEMDDLKDAGMLAEYAEQAEDIGDSAISQALIARSKNRLALMNECQNSIKNLMTRDGHEMTAIESVYEELLKKYTENEAERIRLKLENI